MNRSFFITGTGTDIGKTYVTALLARYTTNLGLTTTVMKPAQTGMTDPMQGDLGKIKSAAPKIMDIPLDLACPYCLQFESSPHLAAELEHTEIDLNKIESAYNAIQTNFHPQITFLESAGGIYVPLNQREIMADIPKRLNLPVVIVADAALGTINHTVLTINELRRREIEVSGVILNRYPTAPGILIRDNWKMIEKLGNIEVLATAAPDGEFTFDQGLRRLFQ